MVSDGQVRLMRQKRMDGKTQVTAAACARHHSDFDVGKLGVERGPFEHKIVRAYRLRASGK